MWIQKSILRILTSLDISEVNTVWTWGDKRPPADNNFFRAILKIGEDVCPPMSKLVKRRLKPEKNSFHGGF